MPPAAKNCDVSTLADITEPLAPPKSVSRRGLGPAAVSGMRFARDMATKDAPCSAPFATRGSALCEFSVPGQHHHGGYDDGDAGTLLLMMLLLMVMKMIVIIIRIMITMMLIFMSVRTSIIMMMLAQPPRPIVGSLAFWPAAPAATA